MSDALKELLGELDEKVEELEKLPYPQVREQVFETLKLVDRIHRPGLVALARRLRDAECFDRWREEDESIHLLFALYDLAPVEEPVRAELALEAVRPYLRSHGGEVEVLAAADGVVEVRLQGACGSCAASAQTLRHGVEAALSEHFEGFRELVVHTPEPESSGAASSAAAGSDAPRTDDAVADSNLVQLRAPVFDDLAALDELGSGELVTFPRGGHELLLIRLGGEVYAYDARCPVCGAALAEGSLSGHVLVCPLTNCAYDVRSGRRVDGGREGLGTYPVAVRGGRVLIATGVRPMARLEAS